jgi:hypothetical protein
MCITVAKTRMAVDVAVIFERRRPIFVFVAPAAADAADDDDGAATDDDDDDDGGSGGGGGGGSCGSAPGRIMMATKMERQKMRSSCTAKTPLSRLKSRYFLYYFYGTSANGPAWATTIVLPFFG